MLLLLLLRGFQLTAGPAEDDFGAIARRGLERARARHEQEPKNFEASWKLARACFDAGEYATNNTERAELAEQAIALSQKLVAQQSNSAPVHYYLAMNLGQLARTKGLGALKLVNQMEREFMVARALDQLFDEAGPDRNLGLLYRDAPSIGSVGSRRKAKQHLQRAVELAPGYPDNRLDLIEAFMGWSDLGNARRELKALEATLPAARTNFSGQVWAPNWADWDRRLATTRKVLE